MLEENDDMKSYSTNMLVYTDMVVEKYESIFDKTRPVNRIPDVPPGSEVKCSAGEKYRNIVSSILWLSRATRPDLARSIFGFASAVEFWNDEMSKSFHVYWLYQNS